MLLSQFALFLQYHVLVAWTIRVDGILEDDNESLKKSETKLNKNCMITLKLQRIFMLNRHTECTKTKQ